MARVSDPVEAAHFEADLGVNLFRDWTVALGEMWLLPLKVWAASASTTPVADAKSSD